LFKSWGISNLLKKVLKIHGGRRCFAARHCADSAPLADVRCETLLKHGPAGQRFASNKPASLNLGGGGALETNHT
jgi:hypothetical protein